MQVADSRVTVVGGGSGTFQEALRPMGGWLGQRVCRQLRLIG